MDKAEWYQPCQGEHKQQPDVRAFAKDDDAQDSAQPEQPVQEYQGTGCGDVGQRQPPAGSRASWEDVPGRAVGAYLFAWYIQSGFDSAWDSPVVLHKSN